MTTLAVAYSLLALTSKAGSRARHEAPIPLCPDARPRAGQSDEMNQSVIILELPCALFVTLSDTEGPSEADAVIAVAPAAA